MKKFYENQRILIFTIISVRVVMGGMITKSILINIFNRISDYNVKNIEELIDYYIDKGYVQVLDCSGGLRLREKAKKILVKYSNE